MMNDKLNLINADLTNLAALVTVRNHLKAVTAGSLNVVTRERVGQSNALLKHLDNIFVMSCLDNLLPALDNTNEKSVEVTVESKPESTQIEISTHKISTKSKKSI